MDPVDKEVVKILSMGGVVGLMERLAVEGGGGGVCVVNERRDDVRGGPGEIVWVVE